jgi:hypothetical protein
MGSDSEADNNIKAIFADVGAGQGPPLRIDAHDIIERGVKIRRRRKRLAAILGTSVTTAAAIVAIALASGQHTGGQVPIQPAGPAISLETVPGTPSPGSVQTPEPSDPRPAAPPAGPGISPHSTPVLPAPVLPTRGPTPPKASTRPAAPTTSR